MIPPDIGFAIFEKRGQALPVDSVGLRFLNFTQFEESGDEVDILDEFFTYLPPAIPFGQRMIMGT